MPGKGDASVGRLVQPADAIEHCGLAGTIGPDQSMDGPFLDLKRDIVNCFESTKVHGETLDRKMRHSSFLDVLGYSAGMRQAGPERVNAI
jgi:hypothetical protein